MITAEEAIAQDQLVPSVNAPGKVCVLYPRGSHTRLVCFSDQTPVKLDTGAEGLDNPFSQFTVNAHGHLEHLLDRSNVPAYQIVGNSLVQP